MGRYVTQFGSTVNVPDEDVDTYRTNGFIAEGDEPKATKKATSRRSAKPSDDK